MNSDRGTAGKNAIVVCALIFFKQTLDAGDWGIILCPIEKIGLILVIFETNNQGMASAAFVINKRVHIDVFLELILVQMNIV